MKEPALNQNNASQKWQMSTHTDVLHVTQMIRKVPTEYKQKFFHVNHMLVHQ